MTLDGSAKNINFLCTTICSSLSIKSTFYIAAAKKAVIQSLFPLILPLTYIKIQPLRSHLNAHYSKNAFIPKIMLAY